MKTCMVTGKPIKNTVSEEDYGPYAKDTLIIVRNGVPIGFVSPEGQTDVRTMQLVITRDAPTESFRPLQAQCIKAF